MAAPLSRDLRVRIVRSVEAGTSIRAAAERFEVSASAAVRLMRRVRETGSAAPARTGGHRRAALDAHSELVRRLALGRPGVTLAEIRASLAERGIQAGSLSTVSRALKRLGLSHRKRR
jgi:transposase